MTYGMRKLIGLPSAETALNSSVTAVGRVASAAEPRKRASAHGEQ